MKKDLERGSKGEKKVIELFQKFGHEAIKNDDKETRSFHDIEVIFVDSKNDATLAEFEMEVKNDEYAAKSGNIALEFYNSKSDKPSGIHITKSHIWAQLAFGQIWFASVKELKKFISKVEPSRTIFSGGDGNADILLYEKDKLFNGRLFYQVDNLEKAEFDKIILKLLEIEQYE